MAETEVGTYKGDGLVVGGEDGGMDVQPGGLTRGRRRGRRWRHTRGRRRGR